MSITEKYIDVILPLPVKGTFTYSTDEEYLLVGQRVVVQFGPRKLYTALVKSIHTKRPTEYEPKRLLAILDEQPIVNSIQLRFWDWLADYYMCNLGDVMNTAIPASFKLASESMLVMHTNFDGDIDSLSKNENALLDVLSNRGELSINEISNTIKVENIFRFVNELIRKEIVQIKEYLHNRYKERLVRVVTLLASDKDILAAKLTSKQKLFISNYLALVEKSENKIWKVSDLLKEIGMSRTILNTLVDKEIFGIHKQIFSRLDRYNEALVQEKKLASFQDKALKEIKDCFKQKKVCLLHGVTSSGKTELYIKLIEEQLHQGKQVLYLLPEIALTTQIIKRLQKHFGEKVGVSHSYLNNSERVEIWNAVKEKDADSIQYPIMLGARSSLFLPFDNLGLIIVDEEHDDSFKQHQLAPRYHARDSAIYLADLHKSSVLLGSATPSLETYYNAKKDKYGLVEMHTRFEGIALPKIRTIDIRKAHLKKQMLYQFSPEMIDEIKEALSNQSQVILFQNRRGYSSVLSCKSCAYTPHCIQCDVSLTYYKWDSQLKCHYCGFSKEIPDACPSCNAKEIDDKGFGTEQVEESLKILFPEHVIRRMDYDTTRSKNAYQDIITDFEVCKIDILVGTQMVAKGLDFDNVSLVGILNADNMLHFPDFRSYERAFQLMMQVAGRAGRKGKQGKVLIQTYDEENEIFRMLKSYDVSAFIRMQAKDRELFNYPPYSRIIKVTLKHKKRQILDQASYQLAIMLRKSFSNRVLGPEYPIVSRVRNYYHKHLLLKIEQESSINKAKEILNIIIQKIQENMKFKSVRFIIDVDPV